MSIKNSVTLIGRLGADPEIMNFESGKKNATFSIATTEKFLNAKGEKEEDTQWHNMVAWGKKAEIAEKYLKKGMETAFEGKLATRTYVNKTEQTVYVTEVIINEILLLSGSGPDAAAPTDTNEVPNQNEEEAKD